MAATTVKLTDTSSLDGSQPFRSSSGEYRTVITASLFGNNQRYIELDTCREKNVKESSTIPSRPIQNGQVMSDHMYRDPDEVTISGAFSLDGRMSYESRDCFTVANIITDGNPAVSDGKIGSQEMGALADFGSADRLGRIERVFKFIKDNGILCDLTMVSGSGDGSVRFLRRRNMALQSISWTERYNSMSYDFTFKEIMQIDLQSYETDLSYSDLYPSVELPSTKSLGKMLQDTGELPATIIQLLYDRGYIDKKDGAAMVYKVKDTAAKDVTLAGLSGEGIMLAGGVLLAVSIAVLSAYGAAAIVAAIGTSAAIFPVGTIIAGAAAIGYGIYYAIRHWIDDAHAREKLSRGFNLIQNYLCYINDDYSVKDGYDPAQFTVNSGDLERLTDLLDSVATAISNAASGIEVYQVSPSQSDNTPFTSALMIGSDLVYLVFTKNTGNAENPWSIKVMDGVGSDAKDVAAGTNWGVITDFGQCSRYKNAFYIDSSRQYEAYIIGSGALNSTQEEDDTTAQNLCSYYVVISQGSMEEKMKAIEDAIKNALEKQGFTD
jgi:hypothetical protein